MKKFKLIEGVGSFEATDGNVRVKVAAGEIFTPGTEAEAALVAANANFEEVKEGPKTSKKTEEVKD